MTLNELKINKRAVIKTVGGEGALRQHFLDMGLIPGTVLKLVKLAPLGDPMEIRIHGYELTLRLEDAAKIEIETISSKEYSESNNKNVLTDKNKKSNNNYEKYSFSEDENGKIKKISIALVGNQNCGKTTLFNQLTGSNQHVGNFPGVTVDRKEGSIIGYSNTVVTDLPGIYSMSPFTNEEIVARKFIMNEKPDVIINILDATNIERNLYLTLQLIKLGIPMVIALNMMDELTGNGGFINIEDMEEMLGVSVIPISAAKKIGIDELVYKVLEQADKNIKPRKVNFTQKTDNKGAMYYCIDNVAAIIKEKAAKGDIPLEFATHKIIEKDSLIYNELGLLENEKRLIDKEIGRMERVRQLDSCAAVADMRFSFIEKICENTLCKPKVSKERVRSRRIDKILTGKYTAIPCFIAIMVFVFYMSFNVVGLWFQKLLEKGVGFISSEMDVLLDSVHTNAILHSLIIDGIFVGVGAVISFLPIIITLFFFLSIMEDSGYIARVAFFMDGFLRKIGLSGRSVVSLLIGFGCSVPAVMSTRALSGKRDTKLTILLIPFMSCSAKIPIYAFFINLFFKDNSGLIMAGLYVIGIITGIFFALLLDATILKGEEDPFVLELPNYRLPSAKNVIHLLWEKAKDFLQKAFTVIFLATIVVWFMQSFDSHLIYVKDSKDSILACLAGMIAPIFAPMGLNDWRIVTSLISGVMAKESVISTMEVLFAGNIVESVSRLSAAVLMVFSLLYTPCVATIATVRRELGRRWALFMVVWQCLIAWVMAMLTYVIGSIMGI